MLKSVCIVCQLWLSVLSMLAPYTYSVISYLVRTATRPITAADVSAHRQHRHSHLSVSLIVLENVGIILESIWIDFLTWIEIIFGESKFASVVTSEIRRLKCSAACPHYNGSKETAKCLILQCPTHDQILQEIWPRLQISSEPRHPWAWMKKRLDWWCHFVWWRVKSDCGIVSSN